MTALARPLAALLLALAALLDPAFARPPLQAKPALWKIERGPATLYLFGTIHLLPDGMIWRDKTIDDAMARSQRLSLEIVLDREPQRILQAFQQLGGRAGLPPLAERVPADKRAALAKLVAASGMPAAALDRLKSWAAGVILLGPAMKQIGLEGGSGIEPQITAIFRAAGKPVDELETPLQQLGFFDALAEPAQRAFLLQVLDDPAKARADFDRLVDAWSKGDAKALARAFEDDPEFTPEVRALLIRKRDEAWADVLAKRLETPGIGFVAVGAGHLVGSDSVQAMLARRGIMATRVQ